MSYCAVPPTHLETRARRQRNLDLRSGQPAAQHRQRVAWINHLGQWLAKDVSARGLVRRENSQQSNSDVIIPGGLNTQRNRCKPNVHAGSIGLAGQAKEPPCGNRVKCRFGVELGRERSSWGWFTTMRPECLPTSIPPQSSRSSQRQQPKPDGVGAGSSERSPVIDPRAAAIRPVRATRPAMIGQAGEQRVFWGGECRQGPQARRITAPCPKP